MSHQQRLQVPTLSSKLLTGAGICPTLLNKHKVGQTPSGKQRNHDGTLKLKRVQSGDQRRGLPQVAIKMRPPPSPERTPPPAYSNGLSASEQRGTFQRKLCSLAVFKRRSCLTSTPPAHPPHPPTPPNKQRPAISYLLEERGDGVTGTEARQCAEAPRRPLGGGHGGGEQSDLERTRRRRSCCRSAPPLQLFM